MNNEKIKKSNEPIFVHSLFRSGSTYVFKKFREKDELYTSYQEPVHEISYLALSDFEILNETVGNKENSVLRHPLLKKSYFAELYDIAGDTLHHLNKEDIYTNYFDNNVNSLCVYLQSIIRNSEHRCVIQECRLTSRISAIKKNIAGMHLYLWRNPWDQWWSYKVTDYFDAANIWILNANNPPNLIERIVKKLNIPKSNEKDLSKALNFYKNKKLNAEDSYFVFYTIWLLSLIEASEQADYLFNIDKLSISDDYKKLVSNELQNRGVQGLDFSDCEIPQAHFANKDIEFFTAIESSVHSLFLKVGYENELLEKVLSLRYEYSPHKLRQDENLSTNQILKDSERARELTRNYMSDLSVLHQKFESEDNNNKYLILQAEQAMHQAIVKARKLEAKVSEAEAKASEAEAKASEAEAKASEAEAKVSEAEAKASEAEAKVSEAEAKVSEAEAKASEAEARISTMLQSSSWRITTLFKWFALQLKLLRVMGVKARFKSLLVKVIGIVVSKSITFITTRPKLKNFCIQLARKLGVDARLRAFQQNPSPKNITPKIHSVDSGELTPYAKDIYLQLQSTIEAESRRKG